MALDERPQRQLLSATLADPEAKAPRLVSADWLEEQGDPLAELVCVQVTLARPARERRQAGTDLARTPVALGNPLRSGSYSR